MSTNRHYRSIFWPVLLIGAGAIWLLSNLGILAGWSWGSIWQFWPVFLIAIGLDMLIARRSPILGAIVALVTIGLMLVLVLAGSTFGFQRNPDVVTEQFSAEREGATSARIELDFSVGPVQIDALQDSNDLFWADLTHLGEVEFSSSGTTRKVINLDSKKLSFNSGWFDFIDDRELRWDIALSPDLPLDVEINGGVGEANVDLSELNLTSLKIDVGVGEIRLYLPATGDEYEARIAGSVGETYIEISDGAAIKLDIEGGVGEVTIVIPDGAAVRLDASIGVGRVKVPSSFRQVSGGDNDFVGEEGIWESPGYASADRQIVITFDGGVGGLILR